MVSWRVRIGNPRTHQVEAPDLSSGCRDYTTGCWPLSGTFFTTCSLLLRPALGIRAGILISSRSLSTSWPSPTPLLVLHEISTTTSHKPNRNSESFDPCLHLKSRTMTSSEAQPAVHHIDSKAALSYTDKPDLSPTHYPTRKMPLIMTWTDAKQEWQTGSRKRVFGHFVASTLIGFLIGWVIGLKVPGSGAAARCP
jgi:hypothetical protein